MEGLKITRVIILDDDEKEGLELAKALWRRRIPALYFTGEENLPQKERLTGVRLAFLDMDLVPGTQGNKSKMSSLVGALRRIVSADNGPYLVVAWTKHKELVPEFENLALEWGLAPMPIGVSSIAKEDCKKEDESFDLSKVEIKLDAKLTEFSPLLFLQTWEESCFEAAIRVTAELSSLAHQGGSTPESVRAGWRSELLRIIYSMASAVAGRNNVRDGDTAIASLCSALNPLHADRLESLKSELCGRVGDSSKEILNSEAVKGCGLSAVARINAMLHCSYEKLDSFYAGNTYLVAENSELSKLIGNPNELISSYLSGNPKAPESKVNFASLRANCRLILVESNPTCDHSQNKVKVARLIAGLLIPRSEIEKQFSPIAESTKNDNAKNWESRMIAMIRKTAQWWHSIMGQSIPEAALPEYRFIKKADFLWELGPFSLALQENVSADYYIVVNALYVFSLAKTAISKEKALFRLRNQAFTNFQFWFSSHAGRPGMLLMR
jgi:hypothetical protein